MDNDAKEIFGIPMSLSDAERLVRWFEMPEAGMLKKFLELQRDLFDDRSEKEIGDNPIRDIINRERNIAAKLSMKSVLSFPDDIRDFIRFESEKKKK
jgi:hypothetical protein